jgi:molybdopterin-guanine dinucleotide biosynthesis protein A
MYEGASLLQRSLGASRGAAAVVVVGPDPGVLPRGVLNCREDPPFGGPAAAVAAGLAVLARARAARPLTLILACDMPNVATAVRALNEARQLSTGPDGVMAVSADGRRQPLVGFYSTAALQRSVQDLASRGALVNGSVTALLASLDLQLVTVPAGSTDDVDTWDDAAALGVASQEP